MTGKLTSRKTLKKNDDKQQLNMNLTVGSEIESTPRRWSTSALVTALSFQRSRRDLPWGGNEAIVI